MLKRVAAAAVVIAALVAPTRAANAAPRHHRTCAWSMYGQNVDHSFAQTSACTHINRRSVTTLLPSWFVPTADSVTASPAVSNGTVYVGSWDGVMHALDQSTGAERWHFAITDSNNTAFGRIESSAALATVAHQRLVIFGGGATIYVLDAATGKQLAGLCIDPRGDPAVRCRGNSSNAIEIESSPAVLTDGDTARIVIGMDVHNDQHIGRTGVLGLKLSNRGNGWLLEPQWKFDPESRQTYTGAGLLTQGAGTGNGCGGVWSSPAVDTTNDLVFFGTSSCSVDGVTSGESMWAIRLSTGAFAWTFAPHLPPWPSERWDDDFGASPNLLPYNLVGDGSKDGVYYALDRVTGKLRWRTQAGEAGHVSTDFAVGGMIGSAAVGWSQGEETIFATTAISTPLRAPYDQTPGDLDPTLADDPGRMFSIHAIRVRDGAIVWRSPLSRASYGAASYANGVVFVPSTFDFSIKAFDADTGLPLWDAPVVGAPSATPIPLGNNLIVAAGTRTTDLEYKAFGVDPLALYAGLIGPSPLSPLSGVWGFTLPG